MLGKLNLTILKSFIIFFLVVNVYDVNSINYFAEFFLNKLNNLNLECCMDTYPIGAEYKESIMGNMTVYSRKITSDSGLNIILPFKDEILKNKSIEDFKTDRFDWGPDLSITYPDHMENKWLEDVKKLKNLEEYRSRLKVHYFDYRFTYTDSEFDEFLLELTFCLLHYEPSMIAFLTIRDNPFKILAYNALNHEMLTHNFNNVDFNKLYLFLDLSYLVVYFDNTVMFYVNYYYYTIGNNIYSNDFKYDYAFILNRIHNSNKFNLIFSFHLDFINKMDNFFVKYSDELHKNFSNSIENTLVTLNHPEIKFYTSKLYGSYFFDYFHQNTVNKTMVSEAGEIPFYNNILYYGYLYFILIVFFTFFGNLFEFSFINKYLSNLTYFISNSLTESEEEIAAYEDLINGLPVLFIGFFWFFTSNCYFIIFAMPANVIITFFFPLFYTYIFTMPLLILYTFGFTFSVFLRGSGSTKMFFVECLYDYIALSAFFIRLLVQNVRLILMCLTLGSFHEVMIDLEYFNHMSYDRTGSLFEEITIDLNDKISINFFVLNFANFDKLVYEVLHTFFVVISQFFAFFAMVFWLFLFFYTSFAMKKSEKYLLERKKKFLEYMKNKLE